MEKVDVCMIEGTKQKVIEESLISLSEVITQWLSDKEMLDHCLFRIGDQNPFRIGDQNPLDPIIVGYNTLTVTTLCPPNWMNFEWTLTVTTLCSPNWMNFEWIGGKSLHLRRRWNNEVFGSIESNISRKVEELKKLDEKKIKAF
ncbi:hypothetical protein CR513_04325, partial [Mucuna pruriens]